MRLTKIISGLRPFGLITIIVGGVALVSACSALLDWSADNKPCLNGECFFGYSCLVNKCILDSSLLEGQTCNKDQQCGQNLVCAPSLFTCRRACNSFFKATSQCSGSQYCKPVLNEADEWEGVCVESDDCSPSLDDCRNAGDVCVKIGANAFACLVGCEVGPPNGQPWPAAYTDNCGGTVQAPKYCQPVGAVDSERLVCLDTTNSAQAAGNLCDPIVDPCAQELACVTICKTHCDPTTQGSTGPPCGPGEQCCLLGTGNDVYALCDDDCVF